MTEWLTEKWKVMKTEDIWQHWPGGILAGIFSQAGFVDNAPIYELIKGYADEFRDRGF